jgi:hypothetical protein
MAMENHDGMMLKAENSLAILPSDLLVAKQ